jgi:hypothetical protein
VRRLLVTCLALTLLGLVNCSVASATWTHHGKGDLEEDAAITLKGNLTLSTAVGEVKCPVEMTATLTGGAPNGHIGSLGVSEPSKCDLTGGLATACGTHGLTKIEETGTWFFTADGGDIGLPILAIDYTFAGCAIPSLRVEGSTTLEVNRLDQISGVTLSGSQTLYNALEEEVGNAELKGSLAVSPSDTYGIKPIPGKCVDDAEGEEPFDECEELNLSGMIAFDVPEYASSIYCQLDMAISFTPEEGAKVSSFGITTETCEGQGLFIGCVVANDEANQPPVDVTTKYLAITNLEFVILFEEGCVNPGMAITWPEATLLPDNPTVINSMTISGIGDEAVTAMPIEFTGELQLSEPGTFGIIRLSP